MRQTSVIEHRSFFQVPKLFVEVASSNLRAQHHLVDANGLTMTRREFHQLSADPVFS